MSFRGASAEAYAALTDALDAALAQGADAAQVGHDLFQVAEVLRTQAALRRVATDLSVDATAKAGLVSELFTGKVAEAVSTLLADAVARRWTQPRDLPLALEELGVVATVKSAGTESARLTDELFTLGEVLTANPDLRSALSDPARSVTDKRGLLGGLLAGKALPATAALADQALAGTHRTVSVALNAYEQLAARVHGQKVATVTVAAPLSDADSERLTEVLRGQHGSDIQLNVVVDPTVIGGVRVAIGDEVIDGTVANRLATAGRQLAG